MYTCIKTYIHAYILAYIHLLYSGFITSIDGVPQLQPDTTKRTIMFLYIGFPFLCNLISFYFKLKYPIKDEQYMNEISEGIIIYIIIYYYIIIIIIIIIL